VSIPRAMGLVGKATCGKCKWPRIRDKAWAVREPKTNTQKRWEKFFPFVTKFGSMCTPDDRDRYCVRVAGTSVGIPTRMSIDTGLLSFIAGLNLNWLNATRAASSISGTIAE